ncbi:unnamed protein product, partial [Polarella glacialis]
AKLCQAQERLVSSSVADILKQDFKAEFGAVLTPEAEHWLPQVRTWMAEAAQKAQAEAMRDLQAAEFIAGLDAQHYGEERANTEMKAEVQDGSCRANPAASLQEHLLNHERQSKLEMLRRHLQEQDLANENQERANTEMKAEVQAFHHKLEQDTSFLMAPLAPVASRAGA